MTFPNLTKSISVTQSSSTPDSAPFVDACDVASASEILPSQRRRKRSGITIVELLVAITVLTVGVTGLLTSAASVEKQMGGGVRQTVASTIAQSRIDSLTSLSCATLANASVATGTATKRGVTETWSVTDGKNIKNISVAVKIIGRKNTLNYLTVIPCRD